MLLKSSMPKFRNSLAKISNILNEAVVGRTVEWQEQYRQQMDELANEFRLQRKALSSPAQR